MIWSATKGAEIAAGAGLVGADLGTGARGAVETGGLEPCIDMHGSVGQLIGDLENALGTVGTQRTVIELECLDIRQVDGHIEAIVRHGTHVAKSGVGTGDAQEVALDLGSHLGRDMARTLCQLQVPGTESPRIRILIPTQGPVVPVGFDEGVARGLLLGLLGDTEEAEVDGLGQLRREAVGEGQLVAVFLLRRRAGVGGTVGVFLDLLAVEHYIYLVAPLAVL